MHFIKTTGAKVVKFGLKVAQSLLTVGAKVLGFIPGVGKPLGKIVDGAAKVVGVVGDHIHATLSHHLQTGMKVMRKALGVMGKIVR